MTKPIVVTILLLPGTIVSELAYILGCLITGGEIRRARIMPDKGADGGQPTTESQSKLGFFSPLVASMFAIVACGAVILTLNHCVGAGKNVIDHFSPHDRTGAVVLKSKGLLPPYGEVESQEGGGAVNHFWDLVHAQVGLLQHFTDKLGGLNWKDWKVWLLIYLSLCLAVRLSVATRPIRPTLAAVVLIAGGIALTGALWPKFKDLMENVWPVLSFIWGLLLLTLVLALLLAALVALLRSLFGKSARGGAAPKAPPKKA